jgi:hypothetical protein
MATTTTTSTTKTMAAAAAGAEMQTRLEARYYVSFFLIFLFY